MTGNKISIFKFKNKLVEIWHIHGKETGTFNSYDDEFIYIIKEGKLTAIKRDIVYTIREIGEN